ncbi:MAG: hypothetical protein ACI9OU_002064 [Candidatus Promineifilaceae bacterium]|jgi:hypothetical protein
MDSTSNELGETQTRVLVYTSNYTIHGDVSLFEGARLTDYMNSGSDFMVITNASVSTPDGQALLRTSFLNLRCDQIVFILEDGAIKPE